MNVKRICLSVIVMALGLAAMAVPAKRHYQTYTQPDGSVVTLTAAGDEYLSYYLTDDGEVVLRDLQGYFCYATTDASGRLSVSKIKASNVAERTETQRTFLRSISKTVLHGAMSTASRESSLRTVRNTGPRMAAIAESDNYGLFPGSNFPVKGSPKTLVILVQYEDVKFTLPDPKTYFTNLINQQGFTSTYGGNGSVSDWFRDASGGQFTPQFDVLGPVTLPNSRAYYGAKSGSANDVRPEYMAIHACQALDATVDFTQYDTSGDGDIDNVFIFYAGQGQASGGSEETVWPHSWYVYSGAGLTYRFDGKRLNRYACTNEWLNSNGVNRPDGIGTFIHEFSHVMGLPDLYAVEYNDAYYLTPNEYSVMDYGPYNNGGYTPPTYSSYERRALGWLTPERLTPGTGRTIALTELQMSNKAYMVSNLDTSKEYFLLENRQQTSWDTYLPNGGLLIWHVDYNSTVWRNNKVNNTATHQYVDIEEAGGTADSHYLSTLMQYPFPGTRNVTSFNGFTTWSGATFNTPLTNIAVDGNGMLTFDVCGGTPVAPDDTSDTGRYELVTTNDLSDGDKVIIVAKDNDVAMGAQNGNYRNEASVVKNGTTIGIDEGSTVAVFTLVYQDNKYSFRYKSGNSYKYLLSPTADSNYILEGAAITANSQANITIGAEGVASVVFTGTGNKKTLTNNHSATRFACYGTTQNDILIYRRTGNYSAPVLPPTSNVPNGEVTVSSTFDVILTAASTSDVIHYDLATSDDMLEDQIYADKIRVTEPTLITAWSTRGGVKSNTIDISVAFKTVEPRVTPNGGALTTDDTVSLTCTTTGATIYYTTDGSEPTKSSTVYTEPFNLTAGSRTVKAIATYSNWNDSDVTTATFTVSEPTTPDPDPEVGTSGDYVLVTNSSAALAEGDKIIIVAKDYNYALGPSSSNGNNRTRVAITKSSDKKTITLGEGTTVEVITLVKDPTSAYFHLRASDGYIYAGSSSKNYLNTTDSYSTNTRASITVGANGKAVIQYQGNYSRNILRYNNTDNMFSCYSSGQQDVAIYRQAGTEEDVVGAPMSNVEGGTIVCDNDFSLELTAADSRDEVHYSIGGTEAVYSGPVTITKPSTVEAWSTRGDKSSERITLTIGFKCATPTFSPEPGEYAAMPSVTLTSATQGAVIRYTTDGTTPDGSSAVYSGAIVLGGEDVTVKAIAMREDWTDSDMATSRYQKTAVTPPIVEGDYVTFDFTGDEAYGMTLLSGTTQEYNDTTLTFTEMPITMLVNGQTRWWQASKANELRFYKDSKFTLSCPDNYRITKVEFTGATGSNWSSDDERYSKSVWEGLDTEVVFNNTKTSGNTAIQTIKVSFVKYASLDDVLDFEEGESFTLGTTVVVVYTSDDWVYVYDPVSGDYALMAKEDLEVKAGDVIVGGWSGEIGSTGGMTYLVPDDGGISKGAESGDLPEPTIVHHGNVEDMETAVHSMVRIQNVYLGDNLATDGSITAYVLAPAPTSGPQNAPTLEGAKTVTFNNRFALDGGTKGTYEYIDGFVGKDGLGQTEVYPILMNKIVTSLSTLEIEGETPIFYNLQGIRVDNPTPGIYIVCHGGRAFKVELR